MRTAIFDLDGTLVDTAIDLMIAGNYTFEELGWTVRLTTDFKDGIVIGGGRSMIRYGFIAEGISYTEKEVDNLYPVLIKNYNRTIDQNSCLYDGIVTVLNDLNRAGWNIGVCTNKPELQANSLLTKLGIRSYFKSFIGSDTVGVAKPNSKPLLAAIELAGGTPRQSVLVGDTKTDRDTATAAGVQCLLVNYGHGALVYDLKTLSPDGLVDKTDEIPEALESLLKAS